MKLTLLRQNFSNALALTRNAIGRSTIPSIAFVRLTAVDGTTVKLVGTDLEQSITVRLGARVAQLGDVLLPPAPVASLLAKLVDEKVTLELLSTKGEVRITSGKTRLNLKVLPGDEHPLVADPQAPALQVAWEHLKSALNAVIPCVSSDGARPYLSGVHFTVTASGLRLAASDGFRVGEAAIDMRVGAEWEGKTAIVPAKAVQSLMKAAGADVQEVGLGFEAQRVTFALPHIDIAGQRVEGAFPDFSALVPQSHRSLAQCDGGDLLRQVRTAAIIDVIGKTELQPGAAGSIRITAVDRERGQAQVETTASVEGDPLTVGLNLRFVADAVSGLLNTGATNVRLDTNGSAAPLRIGPAGAPTHVQAFYLVMPVAITPAAPEADGPAVEAQPDAPVADEPAVGTVEVSPAPVPVAA